MSSTYHQLTADVVSLCHMVVTRKVQVQLLRALQHLEAELLDLIPCPQQLPQVPVKTKNDQKKRVLAFPLSLRSGTTVPRDSPSPKTDLEESQRVGEEGETGDEL